MTLLKICAEAHHKCYLKTILGSFILLFTHLALLAYNGADLGLDKIAAVKCSMALS